MQNKKSFGFKIIGPLLGGSRGKREGIANI